MSKRFLAYLIACATFAVVAVSTPADAGDPPDIQGIDFPSKIGDLQFANAHDFEARAPGLGYGLSYRNARSGGDIYVYNGGVKNVPDGPTSAHVVAQLRQALGDVKGLEAQGVYSDVVVDAKVHAGGSRSRFACIDMRLVKQGKPSFSMVCLSAKGGNFVKVRFTETLGDTADDHAVDFVAGVEAAVWP